MSFIITLIFFVILFLIFAGLSYGAAYLLAYLSDSLTIADTFTPAILLLAITISILVKSEQIANETENEENEPILIFPSTAKRKFRRKSTRKKKN